MPEERIHQRILQRERIGIEADIDEYIRMGDNENSRALALLNQVLLPAMKTVGELFAQGELILPFVLQSAEVMRAATDHLERYLAVKGAVKKGKLVLATVYGDVHDIGKNLVKTILANNGYEVNDLGKQVPIETIVTRAIEEKADAIGLSALLVSTSQQIPLVLEELHRCGLSIPVLAGGAAVNQSFVDRIQTLADGKVYAGGVFYCRDAFDALNALDKYPAPVSPDISHKNSMEKELLALNTIELNHSEITETRIPIPPFWGHKVIEQIPLSDLFGSVNRNALFRISWGVANAKGEKWQKYQEDFNTRMIAMHAVLEKSPWLNASALYGYYPCQSDGDDLIIYDIDQ